MRMLSEDDVNLKDLSAEELDAAWDLWFDIAQATNDADPPYTHGVFAGARHSARWSSSEAETFDRALADQRIIDEDVWKQ